MTESQQARLPELQNMCLDAHFHESTGRGGVGGQLARESTHDSRCGRVDSFGRARSARRKIGGYIESTAAAVMSGQFDNFCRSALADPWIYPSTLPRIPNLGTHTHTPHQT